ncbi:MAG: nucleotidyltransferase family protein [Actinomycetota bacterium]
MTAGNGVAGVILAGGTGSRLGRTKQLLPVGGRPMLQHVVDTAITELDRVVVVLGHDADRVARALRLGLGVRTVVNPHFAYGQSTSLAVGLVAVSGAEAAVVLLGDEPGVQPGAVRAVVDAYRTTGGPVIQARYGGRPGHPVLLGRMVWASLRAVQGDSGARAVLRRHPGWVVAVELGTAPVDVDTWEDYQLVCAGQGPPASTPGT